MSRVVVLLAHGSPDPRSGAVVREASDDVARRTGERVVSAFLDHDSPALADSVPPDATEVVVLPLLLSSAFHARVDVPQAVDGVRREGLQVTLLPPVGHPPRLLDELLRRATGPAVVVAAGTQVDAERAVFAQLVCESSRRTQVVARAAFATGPGPSLADALDIGAVVVPWLLAPGRLLDSVARTATGHRLVGHGLLAEPTMLDVLAGSVAVGLDSAAS